MAADWLAKLDATTGRVALLWPAQSFQLPVRVTCSAPRPMKDSPRHRCRASLIGPFWRLLAHAVSACFWIGAADSPFPPISLHHAARANGAPMPSPSALPQRKCIGLTRESYGTEAKSRRFRRRDRDACFRSGRRRHPGSRGAGGRVACAFCWRLWFGGSSYCRYRRHALGGYGRIGQWCQGQGHGQADRRRLTSRRKSGARRARHRRRVCGVAVAACDGDSAGWHGRMRPSGRAAS